jgi:hypothetical protein
MSQTMHPQADSVKIIWNKYGHKPDYAHPTMIQILQKLYGKIYNK